MGQADTLAARCCVKGWREQQIFIWLALCGLRVGKRKKMISIGRSECTPQRPMQTIRTLRSSLVILAFLPQTISNMEFF
jgi:hypothetical protein